METDGFRAILPNGAEFGSIFRRPSRFRNIRDFLSPSGSILCGPPSNRPFRRAGGDVSGRVGTCERSWFGSGSVERIARGRPHHPDERARDPARAWGREKAVIGPGKRVGNHLSSSSQRRIRPLTPCDRRIGVGSWGGTRCPSQCRRTMKGPQPSPPTNPGI